MHIFHHHLKGALIRNASKLLHKAACTHHVLKRGLQSGAGAGKYPEVSWQVHEAVPAGVSAGAAAGAAAAGAGLGEEPAMLAPSPLPGKL